MLLARAEDDVDPLGLAALEASDLLAVEAELEQEVGLGAPGELGVGDLVAPGAEVGRAVVYAEEEVGVAGPAVVEEGALVDDLGAVAHGREGGLCRCLRAAFWSRRNLDDVLAGFLQRLEIGRLVLVALASDQIGPDRPAVRRVETPLDNREIELRQMRALEEVVEV